MCFLLYLRLGLLFLQGHFSKAYIRAAFLCVLYPSVIIAYFGQSAWIIKNPEGYATSFFSSVPWWADDACLSSNSKTACFTIRAGFCCLVGESPACCTWLAGVNWLK